MQRVHARIRTHTHAHTGGRPSSASTIGLGPTSRLPKLHKSFVRNFADELSRAGGFVCAYPTAGASLYRRFFEQPSVANTLLENVQFRHGAVALGWAEPSTDQRKMAVRARPRAPERQHAHAARARA